MYNFIRNSSITGGLLAGMFLFALPASALDADVFLHASASMASEVASSSTEEGVTNERSSSSAVMDGQPRKSALRALYSLFETLGMREARSVESDSVITSDDMASIEVTKTGDMSATLTWSSPKLTKVTVFYSPVSPVLVSDKTPSATPWKLWNSKQVILRGLSPDTLYHYKVVAVTALGTTTSAEASFRTVAR